MTLLLHGSGNNLKPGDFLNPHPAYLEYGNQKIDAVFAIKEKRDAFLYAVRSCFSKSPDLKYQAMLFMASHKYLMVLHPMAELVSLKGYIYSVPKGYFHCPDPKNSKEWISENPVPIIEKEQTIFLPQIVSTGLVNFYIANQGCFEEVINMQGYSKLADLQNALGPLAKQWHFDRR